MNAEKRNVMLEEIMSEPGYFRECLERREELTGDFVKLFTSHRFRRIYFSGSGSPSHAGLVLKYAAEKLLNIEATYSYPMLFNNHEGVNVGGKYKPEEMVVICPAESGRSKGAVITARAAKAQGIPVVCTTLNPEGVLARECDVVMVKPSGNELALPSTKGHSTGIFLLLLCLVETAKALHTIDGETYRAYVDGLEGLIQSCGAAVERTLDWFEEHKRMVMNAPFYRVIGYGANYGTALETALKFIETHKRLTMAYELEEFMHGPIRTVNPGDCIFFLCAEDGPEKERMKKLYEVVRKMTDNCVLVCSEADGAGSPMALTFPAVNREFLTAVEYLTPMQVLACEIGRHLGFDPTEGMNTWAKLAMEPSFSD